MHACREQYLRMKLKKRKRDTDPMTKVEHTNHDNMPELEFLPL